MPSAPVPAYASACSAPARYSSACSCFGYPATTTSTPTPTATCVTQSDATTIVNGFVNLLTNTQAKFGTSLANSLLADNFQDFSDSIDYLLELPLGSATFPSKQAFSQGQGTQPPIPSVTALNLYHTWNIIAWRFQLNTIPLPVRGINLFVINSAKQIETVYDELNSGAYLYNIGWPECQANWTVSVASQVYLGRLSAQWGNIGTCKVPHGCRDNLTSSAFASTGTGIIWHERFQGFEH